MGDLSSARRTADGVYDRDLVAWAERQAALLRAGALERIDRDNLAEELDEMGRSRRREIRSRLIVLLAHLLKYEFQPQQRSSSWRGTIVEQRNELAGLLDESPSLRATLTEFLADPDMHRRALDAAIAETGLPASVFRSAARYGMNALDRAFWPGEGPHPEM